MDFIPLRPNQLHIQQGGDITVRYEHVLSSARPHAFRLALPYQQLTYAVHTLSVWVDGRLTERKPQVVFPAGSVSGASKFPLRTYKYEPLRANIGATVEIEERGRTVRGALRGVAYEKRYNLVTVVVEEEGGTFVIHSLDSEYENEIKITPVSQPTAEPNPDVVNPPQFPGFTANESDVFIYVDQQSDHHYQLQANTDDEFGTLHVSFQTIAPTPDKAFDISYHLRLRGPEPPGVGRPPRGGTLECYALLENPLPEALENVSVMLEVSPKDLSSHSSTRAAHAYHTDGPDREGRAARVDGTGVGAGGVEQLLGQGAPAGVNVMRRHGMRVNNDAEETQPPDFDYAIPAVQHKPHAHKAADSASKSDSDSDPTQLHSQWTSQFERQFADFCSFQDHVTRKTPTIFPVPHLVSLAKHQSERVFVYEVEVSADFLHVFDFQRAFSPFNLLTPAIEMRLTRQTNSDVGEEELQQSRPFIPGLLNFTFPDVSARSYKGVLERSGFAKLEDGFCVYPSVLCTVKESTIPELHSQRTQNTAEEDRTVSIVNGFIYRTQPIHRSVILTLRNAAAHPVFVAVPFSNVNQEHLMRRVAAVQYRSVDEAASANEAVSSMLGRFPRDGVTLDVVSNLHLHGQQHAVFATVPARQESVVIITMHALLENLKHINEVTCDEIEKLSTCNAVSPEFVDLLRDMYDTEFETDELSREASQAHGRLQRMKALAKQAIELSDNQLIEQPENNNDSVSASEAANHIDRNYLYTLQKSTYLIQQAKEEFDYLTFELSKQNTKEERLRQSLYNVPYRNMASSTQPPNNSNIGNERPVNRIGNGRARVAEHGRRKRPGNIDDREQSILDNEDIQQQRLQQAQIQQQVQYQREEQHQGPQGRQQQQHISRTLRESQLHPTTSPRQQSREQRELHDNYLDVEAEIEDRVQTRRRSQIFKGDVQTFGPSSRT